MLFGNSILKVNRGAKNEVERLKREIDKLQQVESNEKVTIQQLPKKHTVFTPDWWYDLYTDANGNCFSDADPGL